jgi:hypothetical protein
MSEALKINTPDVVHETIDGEAILIHLKTGTYYSLDGVGGQIWEMLQAGAPPATIVAAMQRRFDAEPAVVEEAVHALIRELEEEDLIVAGGDGVEATEAAPEGPFATPVLRKYTDMQEFILLDPLHDVDEDAGWPDRKPE